MEKKNRTFKERGKATNFSKEQFSKLQISQLPTTRPSRSFLKAYKQSEVREIIEGYSRKQNQDKLVEISKLLFAKSPQYRRLIGHFADMMTFAHAITPVKDIKKLNKTKVLKQYTEIGELLNIMNIKHEMPKVLTVAFRDDVFYGYIHRDRKSFFIQRLDSKICQITSIEDGVFNFSIDMSYFLGRQSELLEYADEIQIKFEQWNNLRMKSPNITHWVELHPRNTMCIKINEEMQEIYPPFAGTFDAIYDIEGFKQLRKNKEEIANYMMLAMELPMRKDSEDNNDFMLDQDTFMFFHNMAIDTVPENVGVITSPMPVKPIIFDKDRVDSDGVSKAERDFWSGSGTSQLLFNADKSTSQGLLMSIKTDEEIVFKAVSQIQRWLNRYLGYEFSDLMYNTTILPVTNFNREEMFKMYMEGGTVGVPIKSFLSATMGLDPIQTMNMAYLENDLLKMHEEFIPLMSSHTMGSEGVAGLEKDGAPEKDKTKVSDEGARSKDKPNNGN